MGENTLIPMSHEEMEENTLSPMSHDKMGGTH